MGNNTSAQMTKYPPSDSYTAGRARVPFGECNARHISGEPLLVVTETGQWIFHENACKDKVRVNLVGYYDDSKEYTYVESEQHRTEANRAVDEGRVSPFRLQIEFDSREQLYFISVQGATGRFLVTPGPQAENGGFTILVSYGSTYGRLKCESTTLRLPAMNSFGMVADGFAFEHDVKVLKVGATTRVDGVYKQTFTLTPAAALVAGPHKIGVPEISASEKDAFTSYSARLLERALRASAGLQAPLVALTEAVARVDAPAAAAAVAVVRAATKPKPKAARSSTGGVKQTTKQTKKSKKLASQGSTTIKRGQAVKQNRQKAKKSSGQDF